MQINILTTGIFFLHCICTSNILIAEDQGDSAKFSTKSTHPSWALDETFFSKNHETISLLGSMNQATDAQWEYWKENISRLPYDKKLREIIRNHGRISAGEMNYFSGFENVESVTLGFSIEGVTISKKALSELVNFKKIRHLHISIHGLSDDYFNIISSLPDLEHLTIEFPSKDMASEIPIEMENWKKTELTDDAAFKIGKIASLTSLVISRGPTTKDGDVKFTRKGFDALKSLPKLKYFSISSERTFTPGELDSIRKSDLPTFVRIVD